MAWFAQPHTGAMLESRWIIWDRLIPRGGARAAIEALGPVLPSVLEIAYSVVYALAPFSIAVLYLTGPRDRVDRFLPRVVFFGQDAPSYDTIFRRFNLWMLGNYGIHTSVFPSAHVAGAFAAAFGMRHASSEAKGATRFLFVMAILIAAATVYGGYHYVADATPGLLIATTVGIWVSKAANTFVKNGRDQRSLVAAAQRTHAG